jgi:hypothetical protein
MAKKCIMPRVTIYDSLKMNNHNDFLIFVEMHKLCHVAKIDWHVYQYQDIHNA